MASSSQKTAGRSGVSRILENLKKSVENKDFYESHQFYVTLNHRYHSRGKDEAARSLMLKGAKYFFENEQFESGVHLSLLFVASLEKNVLKVTEADIKTLSKLHKLIPVTLADFENFQNRAIRWSASCAGNPKTGNRSLRKEFAVNLWNARLLPEARNQFMYSDDGKCFAEMLIEFSVSYGHPNECDLFLAQTVLQLLCIRSFDVAEDFFNCYVTRHPKFQFPPAYPLANFIRFLFSSIHSRRSKWFLYLIELYRPSLQRDTCFNKYLDIIGEIYFNIKPKGANSSSGGFFKNLLGDLFSGDHESGDEEVKQEKTSLSPPETAIEDDLD